MQDEIEWWRSFKKCAQVLLKNPKCVCNRRGQVGQNTDGSKETGTTTPACQVVVLKKQLKQYVASISEKNFVDSGILDNL